MTTANRVIVSYVDEGNTGSELETERYRGYLRKARSGPVSVGDEWEEFVSRGCGSTRDVVLRVEHVDGGTTIGPGTEFEFTCR